MTDACAYNAIRAWVNTHRDRLPRTLSEMATYPMAYRRVIYGELPVGLRVQMWQEHVTSFLGPNSPLTPEQQAFVREYRDALPSALTDPDPRQALREFSARGREVLGLEYGGLIMATLGPPEPEEGLPVPPD